MSSTAERCDCEAWEGEEYRFWSRHGHETGRQNTGFGWRCRLRSQPIQCCCRRSSPARISIKLFVYLAALERDVYPDDYISDNRPLEYPSGPVIHNYDDVYRGV